MRVNVNRVILVGTVWIFFEYFILGPYSYFRRHDNGEIIVPGLLTRSDSLLDFPLWYPYAGAGADRLALGFFAGIDTLLFALLPGWLAYQVLMLSQILLATIFTYLLARKFLDLDPVSSLIAGFAFTLSTVSGQFYFAAVVYLPFVIWGLDQALDAPSPSRRWAIVAGLSLFYALTAHAQILLPFPFVIVLAWFWILGNRRAVKDYVVIGAFCLLCILFRAQDIVAMAANGGLSHRPDWSHTMGLLDVPASVLNHLYQVYWEDRSGTDGVLIAKVMLVLFALGLLLAKVRTKPFIRLVVLALLVALVPIATNLVALPLRDAMPFLTKYSFERFHFYLYLFTALGGAYTVAHLPDYVLTPRRIGPLVRTVSDKRIITALVVVLLAFQSGFAKGRHIVHWVREGNYVSTFGSDPVRRLAARAKASPSPFRVASVQLSPAALQAYGLETADGYLTLYSRRYKEFWERVIGPLLDRSPGLMGHFVDWGNQFYLFSRENDFAHDVDPGLPFAEKYDLALLSLANVRFLLAWNPLVDRALVPLAEPARPWSGMSLHDRAVVTVKANFEGWTHWYVYENVDALPRFFLARRLVELADGEAVLDALSAASVGQLRNTAFVERGAAGSGDGTFGFRDGSVAVESYRADRIELTISTDGRAVLIGSNAYSPYWRCLIDGAEVPIFPVDHAFWGVVIEPGAHRVVFSYQPPQRIF